MKAKFQIIVFIGVMALTPGIRSQDSLASEEQRDLTIETAQTLAKLQSITVRNYFVASRWNQPGTANVVEFQSLVPFQVWNQENLMRLNIPFRTESELGPGLSDVRIFDMPIFKTAIGFWGVGPVFNLGIFRGPEFDSFQAGPVASFLYTHHPRLSIGLLNQNFLSGQVALSTLQPIFVYRPNQIWTLSLGELPLVYDWKKSSFAVFSLGFQIGTLANLAGQPVRFFVNPQFNTKSSTNLYKWTIASGVTLPLMPP